MTFDDLTLYARDDEMDEFGDTGGYGESLEEDYEEEEEEEAGTPEMGEGEPEPVRPTPSVPTPVGGGGGGAVVRPLRPPPDGGLDGPRARRHFPGCRPEELAGG